MLGARVVLFVRVTVFFSSPRSPYRDLHGSADPPHPIGGAAPFLFSDAPPKRGRGPAGGVAWSSTVGQGPFWSPFRTKVRPLADPGPRTDIADATPQKNPPEGGPP